jgi:hypothetical protein
MRLFSCRTRRARLRCSGTSVAGMSAAILDHPLTLTLPALAADAAADISRRRAVFGVSRRVAVSAASSCSDHSLSVLVSPQNPV